MNVALRVLCRVIKRRLLDGDKFADIILDYPALSTDEIQTIKNEFRIA